MKLYHSTGAKQWRQPNAISRKDAATAALMARTDLIYSSEIGSYIEPPYAALTNATAISKILDLKIPMFRWAMRDTFTDVKNPGTGQFGTQTRADFNYAVDGIRSILGAEVFYKFCPITREGLGTPEGPSVPTWTIEVNTTSGSDILTGRPGTFTKRMAEGYISGPGIPATARIRKFFSDSRVQMGTRSPDEWWANQYVTCNATATATDVVASVGHDHGRAGSQGWCPVYGEDTTYAQNLEAYKSVVAEAGPRIRVYESNNEMEYTCSGWWNAQGAPFPSAASPGVSTMIGKHYAATMPALKKYARSLGFEIITIGYAGIMGGAGWNNFPDSPNITTFTEFNTAVHDAYVASGFDPDYIPDAVSVHAYPHSGDFVSPDSYSTDYIISYADAWAAANKQILKDIWGNTIGSQIRLAISEWNAGLGDVVGGWSGFTAPTGDNVAYFYSQWLPMLRRNNIWQATSFAMCSNGDGQLYDLVNETGVTRPQYPVFKSFSEIKA